MGIGKFYEVIRDNFYWLHLYEDCKRVVASCVACQRLKQKPKHTPLRPTQKGSAPFQSWAVDYLPRLPESAEGFKHLLVIIDTFSKWVELVPMRSKSSLEVASVFKEYIFPRFGLPLEVRCDRGREFAGDFTKLCAEYKIKQITISTQHPEANGLVERYVGIVKKSIMAMLMTKGWDRTMWTECLGACVTGLRFAKVQSLGYSPFTICTGLEPRIPIAGTVIRDYAVDDGVDDE